MNQQLYFCYCGKECGSVLGCAIHTFTEHRHADVGISRRSPFVKAMERVVLSGMVPLDLREESVFWPDMAIEPDDMRVCVTLWRGK